MVLILKDLALHTPLVHALFSRSCPSAIRRFVMSVRIDSIDGVLRGWTRAHVGVEGLEGFTPARAHGDTAAPIVGETFTRRASAAIVHAEPNPPFSALRHAVRGGARLQLFLVQAATRLRDAALHVAPIRLGDVAAVASAAYAWMLRILTAEPCEQHQSAEALAGLRLRFLATNARRFPTPTAARLRRAIAQVIGGDGDLISATALAQPRDTSRMWASSQDRQAREGLSRQILEWRHGRYFTIGA